MVKVDMHVHSRYSEHPSEWFLKRLGTAESYTDPETVYRMARENGMTYVTLTDHNKIEGALLLKEKYPKDVFTGLEATTYFPEDGCKIHILVYGLKGTEFEDIEKARSSIYDLRDYLKARRLPHSVAHATYSVNGKVNYDYLEKLILLFDVFEGTNGNRNRMGNEIWLNALRKLTPEHIDRLYSRHKIEPFSDDPWIKGFTGGSDDHAALFIGRTYTVAESPDIPSFLEKLKDKKTMAFGRQNDYRSWAFTIYKIAYEFSRSKSSALSKSIISQLTENIFESRDYNFTNRLKLRKLKMDSLAKENRVKALLVELVESLRDTKSGNIDERLDLVYGKISDIADELIRMLFASLLKNVEGADLLSFVRNVSTSIPAVFLSLPFFTSIKHMYQGRDMVHRLEKDYKLKKEGDSKRILWFTDTFNDLNGVSMTLQKLGWLSHDRGLNLRIVTSLGPEEITDDLPPNIINLPYISSFNLPHYEQYVMKIPSVLQSIRTLSEFEPDEIYVSTPGSIGLIGALTGFLMNLPVRAIYHSDFTLEANEIIKDEGVTSLVDSYVRWFYSLADEVKVPSQEYINILESRGYDRSKLSIFRRGIDFNHFKPVDNGRQWLASGWDVQEGANLLYVGRISKDKNLDFLGSIYRELLKSRQDLNLIIAGDGPYLEELKISLTGLERVKFLGNIPQRDLPLLYSACDLLVFPSNTDTFGMTILEAQSCGLPALVSDRGGPQEIILNGRTGYVVKADNLGEWTEQIRIFLEWNWSDKAHLTRMKAETRENILKTRDWEIILNTMVRFDPNTPAFSAENFFRQEAV